MSSQPTHDVAPVGRTRQPRLTVLPALPGTTARVSPRREQAVGSTAPRTSAANPWDRVRFRAESRSGAEQFEETPAPGAPSSADGPAGDRLAAGIVQHAVEALLGARSAAQLARWLSPPLYESLTRRVGLAVRLHGRPPRRTHVSVRTASGSSPAPHVREVAVVIHDGTKVRAAAVRLESFRGRWRAVAIEIG